MKREVVFFSKGLLKKIAIHRTPMIPGRKIIMQQTDEFLSCSNKPVNWPVKWNKSVLKRGGLGEWAFKQ